MMRSAVAFLVLASLIVNAFAQAPLGGGIDDRSLNPVQPESGALRRRRRFRCSNNFRELDGTCTNDRNPRSQVFGSTNRPQSSYFNKRTTVEPVGEDLPSPRFLSNILCTQSGDIFDERGVAEIAVFFGQFVDHTLASTPLNEEEEMDIPIDPSDTAAVEHAESLGREELPFARSQRVRVRRRSSDQLPSNSLSSAVDLTNVYGPTKMRNNFLRVGTGGKLLVSDDERNLLPKNTFGLNNAPNADDASFFLAGDHRSNEHPVLTTLHTLFVREHNRIADELAEAFPGTRDDLLYQYAKKISEAQFQKIVFEEWYPAITGATLRRYRGFRRNVDLTLSASFSTAGFRVGHTMVGNSVMRKGPGNVELDPIPLANIFFQVVAPIERDGIEPFLRGAITTPAQKVDLLVHDVLRNFLFKGIENEEVNFDLVALNLQRGRDHGLPRYNELRREFRGSSASDFTDVSTESDTQRRLAEAYDSVDRVEAFPGMIAEDHVPGRSFGPTLLGLWTREFERLRDGDRLYFRDDATWPSQLTSLPRVQRLLNDDSFQAFRQILLDNTDITEAELPAKVFMV